MAEYLAGRGTTALGIIGTVLGGLGAAGMLSGGGTPLLNNGSGAAFETHGATMHDIEDMQKIAEKDAEIAQLKSERYADSVRDDAKQYGIEIYKELKKDITELKDAQNIKWTDQMVVNANLTNAITAMDGQQKATAALVGQITRTAVPQSAICNFGCGCNSGCNTGCGNNV